MPVKKGDTVSGMYGGKEKQGELEAFIENNPYIAARGVVRDADGNIKHLEIRAGEEIWVPENIAATYKAGYTLLYRLFVLLILSLVFPMICSNLPYFMRLNLLSNPTITIFIPHFNIN